MNPNALKEAADHFYALADLFTQLAADTPASVSAGGPVAATSPAAPAAPSFDELPPDEPFALRDDEDAVYAEARDRAAAATGEGAEAMCPKHRTPYKDGRYGLFCTQISDDPAWRNSKGYCSLTPKNAAQYLRVKAAA